MPARKVGPIELLQGNSSVAAFSWVEHRRRVEGGSPIDSAVWRVVEGNPSEVEFSDSSVVDDVSKVRARFFGTGRHEIAVEVAFRNGSIETGVLQYYVLPI